VKVAKKSEENKDLRLPLQQSCHCKLQPEHEIFINNELLSINLQNKISSPAFCNYWKLKCNQTQKVFSFFNIFPVILILCKEELKKINTFINRRQPMLIRISFLSHC